jgi:hypothetical protein
MTGQPPTGESSYQCRRFQSRAFRRGKLVRYRALARLQSGQIIIRKPFQYFLVGSAWIPATVEPTMFIEKPGEKLPSSGVGGSPDILPRATGSVPNRSNCTHRWLPPPVMIPKPDVVYDIAQELGLRWSEIDLP